MKPTPRQLEAFIAATALGGFTRAAEKMNITQSAVSVLIRQLEDGLNVRLFDRNSRSFSLTPEGREMLPTAERILNQLGVLESRSLGLEKGRDRVSFAVSAGLAPGLLPLVLDVLRKKHPKLSLAIQDIEPPQLIPKVLNEEVEIGFGHVPYAGPLLDLQIIGNGPLSAFFRPEVMPRRRSSSASSITWAEVLRHKIITMPRGMSLRMFLDETLAAHKLRIKAEYEPTLFATAVSLAAQGLGVAIVPSYFDVRFQYPGLVSIPITEPTISRELIAITKRGRTASPSMRVLLDSVGEAMRAQAAPAPPRGSRG